MPLILLFFKHGYKDILNYGVALCVICIMFLLVSIDADSVYLYFVIIIILFICTYLSVYLFILLRCD